MDTIKQQWVKNLHTDEEKMALLLARNERDRNRARESARKNKMKTLAKKYNITEGALVRMIDATNGKCSICENDMGGAIRVDHCHRTGVVRGILCQSCNPGLGNFKDDPYILRQAAEYLERFVENNPLS